MPTAAGRQPGVSLRASDAEEPGRRGRAKAAGCMACAVAAIAVSWLLLVVVDGYDLLGAHEALPDPLWMWLFDHGPVEWLQWLLQGLFIVGAAFTAGQLTGSSRHRERQFLLLLALGFVLLLMEDAGNIRHTIVSAAHPLTEGRLFGLHHRVVIEVPYFLLLSALPLYALLRHGRSIWSHAAARGYLTVGYVSYGIAAAASGSRHLGSEESVYTRLGEVLHQAVAGGRLSPPEGLRLADVHFRLVDGPVEESLELLGAAAFVSLLLALRPAIVAAHRDAATPSAPGDGAP